MIRPAPPPLTENSIDPLTTGFRPTVTAARNTVRSGARTVRGSTSSTTTVGTGTVDSGKNSDQIGRVFFHTISVGESDDTGGPPGPGSAGAGNPMGSSFF